MMTLEKPKSIAQWLALYRLYINAFPKAERKPVSMILRMYRAGKTDIWCAMENGRFSGLAVTINSADTILLDYLAVDPGSRDHGVGTAVLNLLGQTYPGKGLFIEIENTYADVPQRPQRLRRKAFYLRSGFVPMGVMVNLFGVQMELLGRNCCLTYEQYHDFYLHNYNRWAADHISRAVHPES